MASPTAAPPAPAAPVGVVTGVRRTLVLSLIARIPIGGFSLLLVLVVRHDGHSFGLAGLTSGAAALGITLSTPLQGRVMDRTGQRTVLLAAAAGTAVSFAALGALPPGVDGWLLPAVALLCGVALPPVSASVRVLWRQRLDAARFARLVTLDASLQEVAFLLGPLLLVAAAAQLGPRTAIALTGTAWAAVTTAFALLPETGAVPAGPRAAGTSLWGPLRSGPVVTLLLVAVAIGGCIGATEIGVVTLADAHGDRDVAGLLYVAWSLGSLVSGLVVARRRTDDPVRRTQLLLVLLVAGTALLALAPSPGALAPLLALAGAALAPLFGVLFTVMADISPPEMATEAFSLQTAALTIGLAAGAAAAGAAAGAQGAPAAFAFAALAALAGGIAHHLRAGALRRAAHAAPGR